MKIAGILLMISGVLLWLACIFQLPYIYFLYKGEIPDNANHADLTAKILYALLLLAGGFILIYFGRKIRRSSFN